MAEIRCSGRAPLTNSSQALKEKGKKPVMRAFHAEEFVKTKAPRQIGASHAQGREIRLWGLGEK